MDPYAEISVLAVDDHPANLRALDALLAERRVRLTTAASGEEALRLLMDREFALILLDLHLPGIDGLETARLIRSSPRSESTPIIFLTAHDPVESQVMRAYALGAVDFLFKPIIPEVLLAKVRVFIDLFDKTLQISRHAEELREVERRHHELRLEQERRYWRESQLREELALERRIYADRQRQVAILRSIGDAVVAADGDWRITLLNPAAERLTGWSESEALRQPLSRVVRLLDRRTRAPVPISSDGSNPELVLVDRNGREVPVGQNVAAVLAEEQRRVGVVLVLRAEANARRSESFARIRSNAALALESGAVHPSVRPLLNEIKSVCDSQVSSPTVGVSGTYAASRASARARDPRIPRRWRP